jgi:sucrose phosphorylase
MDNANISAAGERRLKELVGAIYGERRDEAWALVSAALRARRAGRSRSVEGARAAGGERPSPRSDERAARGRGLELNAGDALLIAYGDMIAPPRADAMPDGGPGGGPGGGPEGEGRAGRSALGRLGAFLDDRAPGLFSYLHILPFYPYSSDDGFSVIDYRAVDPALGSWEDVEALGKERKLCFDLVLNHASAQSEWFKRFIACDPRYEHYFTTRPLDYDAKAVRRPRTHPLITPFKRADGTTVGVWTTFSEDQVDLNFAEPAVLAEFVDIVLGYAERGATLLRLDAIAYLWKEDGTDCVHRPQTHAVVKFFRALGEELGLELGILTETNVPHDENMSYFGQGDEAHIVYNFSLPPLTLYAFMTGDAGPLARWADGLAVPQGGLMLNFLASHDGVGVTPALGLVDDIAPLIDGVLARGGRVSYKASPAGPQPYELNISWSDAVAPVGATDGERIDALLASYALAFAMDGLPAVYFHSLVGSASWRDGVELLGYNRAINRGRPPEDALSAALDEPGSPRARALAGFRALIRARAARPAFAPSAPRRAYHGGGPVVFIERGQAAAGDRPAGRSEAPAGRAERASAGDKLSSGRESPGRPERPAVGVESPGHAGAPAPASCLAAVNCSARAVRAELPAAWRGAAAAYDPLAERALTLAGDGSLELGPYQVIWLDRI